MNPSMKSPSSIFFIHSILLLISMSKNSNAAATPSPSPPPLLRFACSRDSMSIIDTELCLIVLQSIPKVVAAADLFHLSLAIIESGISNSTHTRRRVKSALSGGDEAAFRECKLAYDQVLDRFRDARAQVERLEFVSPTYDLLTASTDYVKYCEAAMAKHNVRDAIISRGNRVVPIFGLSAFTVVAELDDRSRTPPPS